MKQQCQRPARPVRATILRYFLIGFISSLCLTGFYAGSARAFDESERELPPLEDLVHVEVTSVSKKAQSIDEVPAAVYVITAEDIRRSGIRSIPEALRMAPGIDVAQVTGNTWAISSRGLNNELAESLLVLIDGRIVYSPLFGGVYWDGQDTLLDNIDRIEVIRGPGGTVWGTNAVTGVINIVTKDAEKTQGGYVQAGIGNLENGFAGMRYGARAGDDLSYRVYAKTDYHDRMDRRFSDEPRAEDTSRLASAGWRVDWDASERDSLTFQGDYYKGRINNLRLNTDMASNPVYREMRKDTDGANFIFNWDRSISQAEDISLRLYYDHTARTDGNHGKQMNDIWDIDFQSRNPFVFDSEIIWGLGYRYNLNNFNPGAPNPMTGFPSDIFFEHSRRTDNLFSGFVQVDVPLADNRLHLIGGTKLERNDYTGWEWQPALRFTFAPTKKQVIWGAASRAVTTPSRIKEESVSVYMQPTQPPFPPVTIRVEGYDKLDAQTQDSLELGYRFQPLPTLHIDLTAFYNITKGRFSSDLAPVQSPGYLTVLNGNLDDMRGRGVELAVLWRALDNWQLQANYSYLHMRRRTEVSPAISMHMVNQARSTPSSQLTVRSTVDLPFDLEFDTSVYYVGPRDYINTTGIHPGETISGYTRVDFRLGWHPTKNLELSAALLNTLDKTHAEQFAGGMAQIPTDIPRSYYGSITWRF